MEEQTKTEEETTEFYELSENINLELNDDEYEEYWDMWREATFPPENLNEDEEETSWGTPMVSMIVTGKRENYLKENKHQMREAVKKRNRNRFIALASITDVLKRKAEMLGNYSKLRIYKNKKDFVEIGWGTFSSLIENETVFQQLSLRVPYNNREMLSFMRTQQPLQPNPVKNSDTEKRDTFYLQIYAKHIWEVMSKLYGTMIDNRHNEFMLTFLSGFCGNWKLMSHRNVEYYKNAMLKMRTLIKKLVKIDTKVQEIKALVIEDFEYLIVLPDNLDDIKRESTLNDFKLERDESYLNYRSEIIDNVQGNYNIAMIECKKDNVRRKKLEKTKGILILFILTQLLGIIAAKDYIEMNDQNITPTLDTLAIAWKDCYRSKLEINFDYEKDDKKLSVIEITIDSNVGQKNMTLDYKLNADTNYCMFKEYYNCKVFACRYAANLLPLEEATDKYIIHQVELKPEEKQEFKTLVEEVKENTKWLKENELTKSVVITPVDCDILEQTNDTHICHYLTSKEDLCNYMGTTYTPPKNLCDLIPTKEITREEALNKTILNSWLVMIPQMLLTTVAICVSIASIALTITTVIIRTRRMKKDLELEEDNQEL